MNYLNYLSGNVLLDGLTIFVAFIFVWHWLAAIWNKIASYLTRYESNARTYRDKVAKRFVVRRVATILLILLLSFQIAAYLSRA